MIRTLDSADDERYNAFFHIGLRDFPNAFWMTPGEHLENPFSCAQNSNTTVLAYLGPTGGIIGTVAIQRVENRIRRAHVGWIYRMFVEPQHWGRGIGKELVFSAIHSAREVGITSLLLTVSAGNDRARALYVSQGFVSVGIERNAVFVDGRYRDEETLQLILD